MAASFAKPSAPAGWLHYFGSVSRLILFFLRALAVATVLGVTWTGSARAQDSHYWTHQYGTRATLLGGAVVGSVVDISSMFYNPGALALIEAPNIIAASKVFEFSQLDFSEESDEGINLDSPRFGLGPSFFAGLIPLDFLGEHVIGYSIFTRYEFKPKLRAGQVGTIAVPAAGEFEFLAQVAIESKLSEDWFGLTWGYGLGSRFAVGISQFLAYRSQRGENLLRAQIFSDTAGAAVSIQELGYSYNNFRLLWKAGAAFEWQGTSLGLTVTTPSISLAGSGKIGINQTTLSQDLGQGDPVFVADLQRGLAAAYRSPFSVALGGAYRVGNTTFHITTEYFGRVGQTEVLDGDPFEGQSTGDTVDVDLTHELDDVLNVGIGIEHHVRSNLALYGSFRTDFSAKDPTLQSDLAFSNWNIYFVTAGAAFTIGSAELTLGIGYGWGSSVQEFNAPNVGGSPLDFPDGAEFDYRSVRFILAFAL